MNRNHWIMAAAMAAFSAQAMAQTAFHAGDVVVERVGDGATASSGNAFPVSVLEYSTSGTLVQTIGLKAAGTQPTSAPYNLTDSENATSDGYLNRSADGKFITVSGYNATPGTASVASSASATVGRTIGVISSGGVATTPLAVSMLSGNNYRSVISDGTNYWASGGNGVVYVTAGGSVTSLSSGNARVAEIFNTTLYISSSSTTFNGASSPLGIWRLGTAGSLPTATATATNVIATGTGSSPYDFAFSPSGNWAYVADDRASASGGIQLWKNTGSAFTLQYTLGTGVSNIGARGLTVDFSNFNDTTGKGALIYATTAESTLNRLIAINDQGSGSAATTLATATANYIFRGVDFTPVPEPATYAAIFGLAALGLVAWRRRARA